MMTERKKVVVASDQERFDVTSFVYKHPGGSRTLLQNARQNDIRKMMKGPPHRHGKMAYSLLEEYKTESSASPNDPLAIQKFDLESRVDWRRGMVSQVGTLGADYTQWLDLPVDRNLRLFDLAWLESLTRTPWYLVPIVWSPVVLLNLWYETWCTGKNPDVVTLLGFLLGTVIWSLLEYLLHRFLFHMPVPKDSPVLITVHFLIHGLHHKVPFDPDRLVFPPLGALVLSIPLCLITRWVVPGCFSYAIIAGGFSGYITYDLCHYYLHHGDPSPGTLLHRLKRHHSHHHFIHYTQGFGISNCLWDYLFGTQTIKKQEYNS